MKPLVLALSMAIAATSGMAHAATQEHDMPQQQTTQQAANPDQHEGIGVLKAVNSKSDKVQIAHEAIAGLGWPPMTMWFALRDPLPRNIKVGDTVRFELTQEETKQWTVAKISRK